MPQLKFETNKRICFWGAPAQIPSHLRLISDCLAASGQNSGNLFIGNGLWKATSAPLKEYWDFYGTDPAEFDDRFDVLFVPASNFLFQYTDLKDQFDYFSRTRAQIFMFGLGSQIRDPSNIIIPESTLNFIRLASDRSASIGVRGEFTADIVKRLGISNVEVVGCPSMLHIPDSFSQPPDLDDPDIVLSGNFTNNAREHAFSSAALQTQESQLFAELVAKRGYYILQNEQHELSLLSTLASIKDLSENDLWELNRVLKLFSGSCSLADMSSFIRWNSKIFFDVHGWIRHMKTVDFSFGTRFHGNVAAILAGRPTHVLCHDHRTLELSRLYKIPHSIVDSKSKCMTLKDLHSNCDMTLFQSNYHNLQQLWSHFGSTNGFKVSLI